MGRAVLRAEHGIALPLVMSVMLLVSTLAVVTLTGAIATDTSSNADHRATRAFAAAEGGVDAALFRLTRVTPAPTAAQCLTTVAVASDGAGECPESTTESLGNGASFRYTVSTVLSGGAACAALPGGAAGASFRCVTSTGTVGGVTRRVQARVLVGVSGGVGGGLIGTNSVLLNNSTNAHSCGAEPPRVGSNGSVVFVNSTTLHPVSGCSGAAWAIEYPAGTTTSYGNSYSPNPMTQLVRSTPWTIPAVDFSASQVTNANAALSGTGWNAATRQLNVPSATTRTLNPGTYNFCNLTVPNSGTISLPSGNVAGNVVRIFIDSPDRPGSGCATGTGRLDLINSVRFNAPSGASQTELATRARNLEVYVYGSPTFNRGAGSPSDCGDAYGKESRHVVMCNAIDFAGTIHGPTAKVLLNNSVTVTGGVAARDITLWNSVTFRRPDGLTGLFGAAQSTNAQTAWTQCQSTRSTAADPESGCAD